MNIRIAFVGIVFLLAGIWNNSLAQVNKDTVICIFDAPSGSSCSFTRPYDDGTVFVGTSTIVSDSFLLKASVVDSIEFQLYFVTCQQPTFTFYINNSEMQSYPQVQGSNCTVPPPNAINDGKPWGTYPYTIMLKGASLNEAFRFCKKNVLKIKHNIPHATDQEVYIAGYKARIYYKIPQYDIHPVQLLSPVSSCGLATEEVKVKIKNSGYENYGNNIRVTYSYNGQNINGLMFGSTSPIASNSEREFTFTQKLNLSAPGNHHIKVWTTELPTTDPNYNKCRVNDTISVTVINTSVQNITPSYSQNFEGGSAGWSASGTNSSWQRLVLDNIGQIKNHTLNNISWQARPAQNINEKSYLTSPCFDFTSFTEDPTFGFYYNLSIGDNDSVWVEYSIDRGPWTKLQGGINSSSANWYNNTDAQVWTHSILSSGWRNAYHKLTGAKQKSNVRIRFVASFNPGFGVPWEGFAVDNIKIFIPQKDLAVSAVLQPGSGCGLQSSIPIRLEISNNGSQNFSGTVDLGFKINSENKVEINIPNFSVNKGDKTYYTFSTLSDFSADTIYSINAWVKSLNDDIPENDTLKNYKVYRTSTVHNFPHKEDFSSQGNSYSSCTDNFVINGSWKNISSVFSIDEMDWLVNNGSTPTTGTGPEVDHTQMTDEGKYAYIESSGDCQGSVAYLLSPCFDLTGISEPELSFWYHMAGSSMGDLSVEFLDPATRSWTSSGFVLSGPQQSGSSDEWKKASVPLDAYAGSVLQIRFKAVTKDGVYGDMAIDDIVVHGKRNNDAAVISVNPINSGCGLGVTPLTAKIVNFSVSEIPSNSLSVYYSLNGVQVSEVLPVSIPSGDTLNYTFNSIPDLSAVRTHNIKVWTALQNDEDLYNDTIVFSVVNKPIVAPTAASPYIENFESESLCSTTTCQACPLAGFWEAQSIEATKWKVTNGNTSSSNFYFPAVDHTLGTSDGKFLYAKKCNNFQTNEAVLQSGCVDLNQLNSPVISFFYYSIEGQGQTDSLLLEVGVNGTWTKVWSKTLNNFSSLNWERAIVSLNNYQNAGIINFRFRAFVTGYLGAISLDDITVSEQPSNDVGLIGLLAPVSGCAISQPADLKVRIKNYGPTPALLFDIFAVINGDTIKESVTNPVPSNGGTLDYTFSHKFDFSQKGTYDIKVYLSNPGDVSQLDDTLFQTVVLTRLISSFNYREDFNAGKGDWETNSSNSDWAHGISGKFNSSNKGWYTRLTDNYYPSKSSILVSPCLDFSSLTVDPILTFSYACQTEQNRDGMYVEYLNESGVWIKLGTSNSGINWYNNSTKNWFDGGTGLWKTASHTLSGMAGKRDIKIRFVFESDFSGSEKGVGIDNVIIRIPLQADFTVVNPCATDSTFFISNSQGDISFWEWQVNGVIKSSNSLYKEIFNSAGPYSVKLTVWDNVGYTSNIVKSVSIDSKPQTSFDYIMNGTSVTFTNNSTGHSSVLWNFGDGDFSNSLSHTTHTYSASGIYEVRLIAYNEFCSDTAVQSINVSSPTSIKDAFDSDNALTLYPNPNEGKFTLVFSEDVQEEDILFELYSLQGNKIRDVKTFNIINQREYYFDLNDIRNGFYLLKVLTKEGSSTIRLIIN